MVAWALAFGLIGAAVAVTVTLHFLDEVISHPATITLTSPGTRERIGSSFTASGNASNLQPGETIWAFASPQGNPPQPYILGLCELSTSTTWSCNDLRLNRAGSYELTVAVVSSRESVYLERSFGTNRATGVVAGSPSAPNTVPPSRDLARSSRLVCRGGSSSC
jgi:hypothetical protein